MVYRYQFARMQFKPSKSRSISIFKGKVADKTFFINGEGLPTVSEKPVKSLGRWYDGDLMETVQVGEIRLQAVEVRLSKFMFLVPSGFSLLVFVLVFPHMGVLFVLCILFVWLIKIAPLFSCN